MKYWYKRKLRKVLKKIYKMDLSREGNDFCVFASDREKVYNTRNTLVKHAVYLALRAGYNAGYMIHTPLDDIISGTWEPEWGVVACIELPTGQITWHMDGRGLEYDGHSDNMKWARVLKYIHNK